MTESLIYSGRELKLFSKAKNWKQYFCRFIIPHIKGRVLEAGAGLGSMTSYLNKTPGLEWVLLEPDVTMASLLKEKIATGIINSGCTVINGTIDNAGNVPFDTIIYIDVLEHIEDDHTEIIKAAALLNPGGKLIVLSPAFQFLFSPFDKAIGHYRRYSKKSLQKVIEGRMKNISIHYLDTAGFFSSLANRLFLKQEYPLEKQIIFWDRFLIPVSVFLDKIFFYSFGKSILGIWEK